MNKLIKIQLLVGAGVASLIALGSAAKAAPLTVASYSMPNGDGQAHGGSYNYWDRAYSGSGATTTDGAALTGGTGDLTDGVVASDFWFNVENGAGTGPYVGWYGAAGVLNPLITFNFSGPVTVGGISIHLDNSGAGGVYAPQAIKVDGISQIFAAPALGTIGWVTLSGLNFTGASHTIEFDQLGGNTWTFVSEIAFSGSGAVPEPASWAMMAAGFGAVGFALRGRRTKRVRLA